MKAIHKQTYGEMYIVSATWCGIKMNEEHNSSGKWDKVTCKKCIKKGDGYYGKDGRSGKKNKGA